MIYNLGKLSWYCKIYRHPAVVNLCATSHRRSLMAVILLRGIGFRIKYIEITASYKKGPEDSARTDSI